MFIIKSARITAVLTAGIFLLSGCGINKRNKSEPVTLTWYIPAVISGNEKTEIFNQVNEILKERYNLKLNMVGIDSNNFTQKMKITNAGKETYDLAFTSNWCNNYLTNVSNGVFYEITEKDLKEYAPNTYASMSEEIWSAVKTNSKIYAVPNWQSQIRATGIFIPDEFLKATGTDIDDIDGLEQVTEYLRKITAINPNCNKIGSMWSHLMTYNNFIDAYEELLPGAIDFTKDGKPILFNQYETQEFEDYINLRRSWVAEGLSSGEYRPDPQAANYDIKEEPLAIHQYSPMGASVRSETYGYTYRSKQLSNSLMSPLGVTAAMTGISATSRHPTEALRLIEIINTDSEIMNLIAYGIEDINYEKISDNQIKVKASSNYKGPPLFAIGSMANAYLLENQPENLIEETKKFDDGAISSPLMGFNADLSSINVEVENCRAVIDEYLRMLEYGFADEAKLMEFRERLKLAGADKIILEIQGQIDKWYEAK